jgi:hypothetical protein
VTLLTLRQYVIQLQKEQNYLFRHGKYAAEAVEPHNYTEAGCTKDVRSRRGGYEKHHVFHGGLSAEMKVKLDRKNYNSWNARWHDQPTSTTYVSVNKPLID